MATTAVFLDTMLFQQYRFPDELDWPRLMGVPEVELLIAPVVMRQLNRHKDVGTNPRLRKRAADALIRLGKLFDAGPVAELRRGVTLRYIPREPALDFGAYGLARDIEDDQLVASLLVFRQQHPERSVLLATVDVGLRLKVGEYQIATVAPPDDQKLPDEPDPREQEITALKREREELLRRVPALTLGFTDHSNHTKIVLPRPVEPSAQQIERQLAVVRRKYPHMELPRRTLYNLAPAVLGEIPDDEIVAYNGRLDRFYREYARHLTALVEHRNLRQRALQLDLLLRNGGTAPADDIDVFLRFPSGCEVADKDHLPEPPEPPEPPERPRKPFALGLPFVPGLAASSIDRPSADFLSPLQIKRLADGYEARFHIKRLKQRLPEPIDRLYVIFDSFEGASSFGIDYRINAADLAREVEGRLGVVVSKAEGDNG